MKAINKVIISGRLGKIPEVRYFSDQTPVAEFSLAVDRPVKRGDAWETESTWHDFRVVGAKVRVISESANPGDEIYVEGRLAKRQWQGNDGRPRTKVFVEVEDLMLRRKHKANSAEREAAAGDAAAPSAPSSAAVDASETEDRLFVS